MLLRSRESDKPSTECVIEGLKLCLYNNNSIFANDCLLQTNDTATGAPNSCSYADIAASIDKAVIEKMESTYPELMFFGQYRDDSLSVWCVETLQEFFNFMNSLNDELQFTMEIGNNEFAFLTLKSS